MANLPPRASVQRVARQLVQAMGALPDPAHVHRVLLTPLGVRRLRLARTEQRAVGRIAMPLHVWEQFVLPMAARGGPLLNLAGGAPLLTRRVAAPLHDAALFDGVAPVAGTLKRHRRVPGACCLPVGAGVLIASDPRRTLADADSWRVSRYSWSESARFLLDRLVPHLHPPAAPQTAT